MTMRETSINITLSIDENNLPQKIEWEAPDSGEQKNECKSVMLAIWDARENNTLRVDLWTRDMMVDEMKKFYHQNILTLTDTYLRATGDEITAKKVKTLLTEIGKENGVLK